MKRHFRLALVATFAVVFGALALRALALQPSTDPPKPFTGKVVGVTDGDTITVLHDRQPYKIRLEGIDAPESGQAFGTKAKQVLGAKIFGKEVKVVWKSRDRVPPNLLLNMPQPDNINPNVKEEKDLFANIFVDFRREGEFQKWAKGPKRYYFIFRYVLDGDELTVDGGARQAVLRLMKDEKIQGKEPFQTPRGWLAKYLKNNGPGNLYDRSNVQVWQRKK
jgi:hypothetical protein